MDKTDKKRGRGRPKGSRNRKTIASAESFRLPFRPEKAMAALAHCEKGYPRDVCAKVAGVAPQTLDHWIDIGLVTFSDYTEFATSFIQSEARNETEVFDAVRAIIFDNADPASVLKASDWIWQRLHDQSDAGEESDSEDKKVATAAKVDNLTNYSSDDLKKLRDILSKPDLRAVNDD